MLNKLTTTDKINKTLEYCDYVKVPARILNYTQCYRVEIENTVGDQLRVESIQIDSTAGIRPFLYNAVYAAQEYSLTHNCLCSVKVWIKTYDTEGKLIDEEPIDDYEINFENGIEVR